MSCKGTGQAKRIRMSLLDQGNSKGPEACMTLGLLRELVDKELKKGEWQEIKLVSRQGTQTVLERNLNYALIRMGCQGTC